MPARRPPARVRLDWHDGGLALAAVEPDDDELVRHAPALAVAYSHPRNAPLLGHTVELTADDVVEHYRGLAASGARQFHLFVDGDLAGDADLRGLAGGAAEFAFLIASPAAQGRGLGTRFARMIHGLAFAPPPDGLGLKTIYASVVPANTASLRVFARLGYREDGRPAARAYADDPGDVVLSIARDTFVAAHADLLAGLRITRRAT